MSAPLKTPARKGGKKKKKESEQITPEFRARVAAAVAANPFLYLTHTEARALFYFGRTTFRALISMGAPQVSGKVHPVHFRRWLWANQERIGKLTEGCK